ncbi:hypothetical protein Z945_2716 [Sulfitobacter noctilucae]|uniref:hypothetical protein n=1 Tax=Sulfitobacter noctilucae TaxID=1342302 RepID=UPI00046A600D|nr:hypothetical protein [Sulfitobacter noctilucae]KIN61723.1 hypothetical protein Z945_2716 [Sulfitobacter noctilucae]
MYSTLRPFLILLICFSIVLPKATAALAVVLPDYGQILTICTPDGIMTLRVDANGNPVEDTSVERAPCLLAHADLAPPSRSPTWVAVARQFDTTTALHARPSGVEHPARLRPPARAPPNL